MSEHFAFALPLSLCSVLAVSIVPARLFGFGIWDFGLFALLPPRHVLDYLFSVRQKAG